MTIATITAGRSVVGGCPKTTFLADQPVTERRLEGESGDRGEHRNRRSKVAVHRSPSEDDPAGQRGDEEGEDRGREAHARGVDGMAQCQREQQGLGDREDQPDETRDQNSTSCHGDQ